MFLTRMQLSLRCSRKSFSLPTGARFSSKSKGIQSLPLNKRWCPIKADFRRNVLPSSYFSTLSCSTSQMDQTTPFYQSFSHLDSVRWYSATPNPKQAENQTPKPSDPSTDSSPQSSKDTPDLEPEDDQPTGILARFKAAYKDYGKALICVHVVTSSVWFGSFYYAAYTGLDIVPLLKWMGFSDRIISPFESSGVGNIAVAYLLYKIATPARYTVTILGTQYCVRYLRYLGYMEPVPEGSRIRDLVKESREQVKGKYEDLKEDIKDKKDEYKEKYEEKIEQYKDKLEERKGKVKDKLK